MIKGYIVRGRLETPALGELANEASIAAMTELENYITKCYLS